MKSVHVTWNGVTVTRDESHASVDHTASRNFGRLCVYPAGLLEIARSGICLAFEPETSKVLEYYIVVADVVLSETQRISSNKISQQDNFITDDGEFVQAGVSRL